MSTGHEHHAPVRIVKVEPTNWEALARFVNGECTPAEAAEIRGWLAADPSRQRLLDQLTEHLSRQGSGSETPVDVEAGLAAVWGRIHAEPVSDIEAIRSRKRFAPGWLRVAAILLVAVAAGLLWRLVTPTELGPVASVTFATAFGQTDSLRLTDGTLVVLGPGSELTLATGYGAARREVSLSGQAYFDVVDHAAPFIVLAGSTIIEDLGTAFTVHSDPDGPVRVAVTSGSVAVRPPPGPGGAEVVLREGDRAAVRGDGLVVDRGAVAESDLLWMRGTLAFDDAPMTDVAFDFRRWFGVHLTLANPELATRRITAAFAQESPAEAVRVIALALGAGVDERGDTIVLTLPGGAGP